MSDVEMDPTRTEIDYELDVYGKRGITLVRGEGARVWDDAGREYLDCISTHGAAILGHTHPAFAEALSAQAAVLATVPGTFDHPQKTRFAKRLVECEGKNDAGKIDGATDFVAHDFGVADRRGRLGPSDGTRHPDRDEGEGRKKRCVETG